MDDDFDEFGNFIGQEYSESDNSGAEDGWEDEVEIVENENDEQSIFEPLVKRRSPTSHTQINTIDPPTDWDFICGLRSVPSLNRYFAIVGLTNHGKTSLFNFISPEGFINVSKERRLLTMSSKYASTVQKNAMGKSFLINAVDTPGHEDFIVERVLAQRSADGNILVVDCVEGTSTSLSVFPDPDLIVITKLDRLMLEMKLPPQQAFERLDYLITEELKTDWNSVVFVSTKFKFSFTLASIAKLYRKYQTSPSNFSIDRLKVKEYVLDPIFKLMGYGLIGSSAQPQLTSVGIHLTEDDWQKDYVDRVTLIMSLYLDDPTGSLINAIYEKIPEPPSDRDMPAKYFTHVDGHLTMGRAGSESISSLQSATLYRTETVTGTVIAPFSWFYIPLDMDLTLDEVPNKDDYSLLEISIEPLQLSHAKTVDFEKQVLALPTEFRALSVRSHEAGYYSIRGTGELYLDTALKNLLSYYRVSQPLAVLMESVSSESQVSFPTKSQDLSVSLSIVARPAENENFECPNHAEVWATFRHSCYVYGPRNTDEKIKQDIVRGIESCINSGPLIEGNLCNVTFEASDLYGDPSYQWFSTARRASCAAVLLASPRLMEPIVSFLVTGKLAAGKAVYSEIEKRSGEVISDQPVYGTNLYVTECELPLMDSLALSLDILCQMDQRNDATIYKRFNRWVEVSGDPLDSRQATKRMQPADKSARARDFMLKIRRFKGLSIEPDLSKYVDAKVMKVLSM